MCNTYVLTHVFSLKVKFSMSCYGDLTFCDFLILIFHSLRHLYLCCFITNKCYVGVLMVVLKKFNMVENSDIKDFWKKRDKTNNNQY